jgi:hypothetical protein
MDYRVPSALRGQADAEYPTGDGSGAEGSRRYAQYTRALWDEQEEALRPLHETWMRNLLFLSNHQWRHYRGGRFLVDPVPPWHEQPVINICLPFFRMFLAKVTRVRPAWNVTPSSPDPDDVQAALMASEILEAKWIELRMDRVLRRAVAWAIVTGNGYMLPYWNTSTGRMKVHEMEMEVPVYEEADGQKIEIGTEVRMVPLDEDGEPKLDKDGNPNPDAEPYVTDLGDVGVRVPSPFHVRVNPEALHDDDVTWYIVAEARTLREIQDIWPEAFEGDIGPTVQSEELGYLEDVGRVLGGFFGSEEPRASPADQRARDLPKGLVLRYFEKPCDEYPKGRHWVVTKDVLLEKPTDLPEGGWPGIVHLTDIEIPGRYHAASTFESVVPLNREYNEITGKIKEHHNLFIQGKWLNPRGSGLKKGSVTRQPGEVITYNMPFKPEQADIKPLPGAVYEERRRVMEDYHLVGGFRGVSMGAPPPGVTAGVAFLQLQEADDTDLAPFLHMLEGAVAQLSGSILRFLKANYNEERFVSFVGPNRKFQVRSFRGSDLEGAVDVVPIAESSFPWSRTARQSMLMSMAQQNPALFTDPETGQFDRSAFARLLPIGGLEVFADAEDIDVNEALNEEDIFATYGLEDSAQVPEVGWWQNHDIHYQQHVRILKSGIHKRWSPEAQEMFMQHVMETKERRDQSRAQQNIEEGGTPPGQQAPPGPDTPPDQLMEQLGEGAGMEELIPEGMGLPEDPAAMEQQRMMTGLENRRFLPEEEFM